MRHALTLALILAAAPLTADEAPYILVEAAGSYDDTTFSLENAIIARGLVVDHVSHVGEMLARTGADLGAQQEIYTAADVYQFCSAVMSRKMMETDPWNIVHCPYSIFVAEREGQVTIGFANYPEGEMKEVQALLHEIADEAAAGF